MVDIRASWPDYFEGGFKKLEMWLKSFAKMRYNAHPALKIQAGKIISNQTKIRPALGRKMISGIVNLVKNVVNLTKTQKKC